MKRYYVCKIIGDGSYESPYRAAIADIVDQKTKLRAFTFAATIKSDPATGKPVLPWCLVIAAGADHSLVQGNPDIDPMPDFPLDAKLAAMDTDTKIATLDKLSARTIDTTTLSNADGYRDLIRSLGQKHVATFDENKFDVVDA